MNTPTTTLRRTRDRWATSMNSATKAGRTGFRSSIHLSSYGNGEEQTGASEAGTSRAVPIIASHSAENTGSADCKQIFIEKK